MFLKDFIKVNRGIVITSYSIHYTKLYEVQLIIFEMKKLFLNKKTLIITMIFIMLPFLINILEEHNKINKYGNAKELYDYCLPFEGSINPEIVAKSKIKTEQYFSNLNSAEYKKATSDTEMYFYIDYNNAASANQRRNNFV